MEIILKDVGATKNYFKYELKDGVWIATVYVPKSLMATSPKNVKVVVE